MKTKKNILKNISITLVLLIASIAFTLLVKNYDLSPIGPDESIVGFAKFNTMIQNLIGENNTLYNITDYLGYVPIIMTLGYAVAGFIQLLKRKSLFKVDKCIYTFAGLLVITLGVYIFFEKCIINYRPVLIEGLLEASYPSSHTMLTICLCLGMILLNVKFYKNIKCLNYVTILSLLIMFATVIGRILSGVHWATDIIGGLLISLTLISAYNTVLNVLINKDEK